MLCRNGIRSGGWAEEVESHLCPTPKGNHSIRHLWPEAREKAKARNKSPFDGKIHFCVSVSPSLTWPVLIFAS